MYTSFQIFLSQRANTSSSAFQTFAFLVRTSPPSVWSLIALWNVFHCPYLTVDPCLQLILSNLPMNERNLLSFTPPINALLGTLCVFVDLFGFAIILTLPPWIPLLNKISSIFFMFSLWVDVFFSFHENYMYKWIIFSRIIQNACNLHIWTLLNGISKIGFREGSLEVECVRALVWFDMSKWLKECMF